MQDQSSFVSLMNASFVNIPLIQDQEVVDIKSPISLQED